MAVNQSVEKQPEKEYYRPMEEKEPDANDKIKLLSNAFNIAMSKKVNKKEKTKLLQEIAIQFHKDFIAHDALKQAVVLSKDKKRISEDAERFIADEIRKIAEGK